MPPSLKICWARWARSCVDLVWIVLSCQATQAERPDSLTQSKPNLHMVLLHSAQHFWVMEAWITATFNCPIQIPIFFQKTSTIRCPLPANLIKSMDIEKNSQLTKTSYGSSRGQTISHFRLLFFSCVLSIQLVIDMTIYRISSNCLPCVLLSIPALNDISSKCHAWSTFHIHINSLKYQKSNVEGYKWIVIIIVHRLH